MVKKYIILVSIFALFLGCAGKNAPECFKKSGVIIREEIVLDDFSTITVFEGIKLVVKQSVDQKVEIETGKNLRAAITAEVINGRLILRNEEGCNLVRDFGLTTIYVSSPMLAEIRSSTGFPILSDGVLTYPSLNLLSESFNVPEADTTDGEFNIEVNSTNLNIVSNGIAYFKIKGTTINFNVNFAAGDSRLEAQNLIAENIAINHRGTNDMLVNPLQSLRGQIVGTGDVISYYRPLIVEVVELYRGKLIYKD